MQRILVTGGLGFLGGRIASHLAATSPETAIRITARDPRRRANWARQLDVVQADVRDPDTLRIAMRGVTAVVHLASVDENASSQDPDLALEVNGRGTRLVLEAAVAEGVQRFLYMSTFHVYGPSAVSPVSELTVARPVHPYAITHRVAEDFVWEHVAKHGIVGVVARLSNGFGYPMDENVQRWTLVFNDLCLQAVTSGRLILRTPGLAQRDFIPLSDVARAVGHLLGLPAPSLGDGLFNLGSGRSLSIREVADLVATRVHATLGRTVHVEAPQPKTGEPAPAPLTFDVRRLLATGFTLNGAWDVEVDGTLDVAQRVAAKIGKG